MKILLEILLAATALLPFLKADAPVQSAVTVNIGVNAGVVNIADASPAECLPRSPSEH